MKSTMRREDQALTKEEAMGILRDGEYGILSTTGPDNIPYGVPTNYALVGNTMYFHCTNQGSRKIDNIRYCDEVSFCVITESEVVPKKFTAYYKSAIASGKASIVEDNAEKEKGIIAMLEKYYPNDMESGKRLMDKMIDKVFVFKVDIDEVTGKANG
ncbi:MAG: pyridoxamine 5'-phosphate oxidase family protein [Anaerovoracaceae bacterium]